MDHSKILTVFTPTYNRAYILPQLYHSLKKQTMKNFEWVIVDDGSSDNTEELVKAWMEEEDISLRYIKQENGGKMKAHNTGVQETQTELFFCVDSDDFLVDTAVETILNAWADLDQEKKKQLAGMIGYKGVDSERPIGNEFPVGISQDRLGGFYEKGFAGDASLIFRTEVIREYPFPMIGSEKFITEAYVYDQIDRKFEFYAVPNVLMICEYRTDGLTQNLLKTTFNNPCGYVAYFLQKGNFSKTIKGRFLAYLRASAFEKFTKNVEMPVYPSYKFLYVLSRPFGKLLFLKKKREYLKKDMESNK